MLGKNFKFWLENIAITFFLVFVYKKFISFRYANRLDIETLLAGVFIAVVVIHILYDKYGALILAPVFFVFFFFWAIGFLFYRAYENIKDSTRKKILYPVWIVAASIYLQYVYGAYGMAVRYLTRTMHINRTYSSFLITALFLTAFVLFVNDKRLNLDDKFLNQNTDGDKK